MTPQGRETDGEDNVSSPPPLASADGSSSDVSKKLRRRRDRLEADARSYLDKHQVLTWVQDVIQELVQDRPEDPWDYIVGGIASRRSLTTSVHSDAKVEKRMSSEADDIRLRMRTALSHALGNGHLQDALRAMPQRPDKGGCASYAAVAQAEARESAAKAAALADEIASAAARERPSATVPPIQCSTSSASPPAQSYSSVSLPCGDAEPSALLLSHSSSSSSLVVKARASPKRCNKNEQSMLLSLCGEGGNGSPSASSPPAAMMKVSRKSCGGSPISSDGLSKEGGCVCPAKSLEARSLLQELVRGQATALGGQQTQRLMEEMSAKQLAKSEGSLSGGQRLSPASSKSVLSKSAAASPKKRAISDDTDVFRPTDVPTSPGPPRGAAPAVAGSAAKAAFSLNRAASLPSVAARAHHAGGRHLELGLSPGTSAIELHIQMRNAQCRQENEDLRKENLDVKKAVEKKSRPRRSSCQPLDDARVSSERRCEPLEVQPIVQSQMDAVRSELGKLFHKSSGLSGDVPSDSW